MFILNYHFDCDIIQWVPVVCCRVYLLSISRNANCADHINVYKAA